MKNAATSTRDVDRIYHSGVRAGLLLAKQAEPGTTTGGVDPLSFDGSAVEDGTQRYEQKAETQGRTIELTSTRMVTESEWEGRPNPVALTPLDGSTGGQTIYVETPEPHRVVKVDATLPAMMGGGTATAVLAPAE